MTPDGSPAARQLAEYERAVQVALLAEYHEIFTVTAILCLLGALIGLALGGRPRPAHAGR